MRCLRTVLVLGVGGVLVAVGCHAANRRLDAERWHATLTWDAARTTLRGELSAPAGRHFAFPRADDTSPFVFADASAAATEPIQTLRWSLDLREAVAKLDDADLLAARGRGFVGALPSLLWLPDDAPDDAKFSLRVEAPAGQAFVCASGDDDGSWHGSLGDLRAGPACAFGDLAVRHLRIAGARVTVAEPEARTATAATALDAHVLECAAAVASYYGAFPVDRLLLLVLPAHGNTIANGSARGYGGASIRLFVPRHLGAEQFAQDWVLIHEMVHLAMPSLPPAHHWLEEGAATYLEPHIQVQAGRVRAEDVWTAMLTEYEQGLAAQGAGGLDDDASWGRTYYGGALFCLLADLRIRERTNGVRSLRDALRALPAAGANLRTESSIEAVLARADAATGTTVLRELYEAMGRQPMAVDLPTLWRELGVQIVDGRAVFDDTAPRARLRSALLPARAR